MPKTAKSEKSKLEKIDESLKDLPTSTNVKAWSFQIDKQYYVILSYFIPRIGNQVAVFTSNKKGIKTSTKPIVLINNSKDMDKGYEEALKILVPEELEKSSELSDIET